MAEYVNLGIYFRRISTFPHLSTLSWGESFAHTPFISESNLSQINMRELLEGFTKQLHMALEVGSKIAVTQPEDEIRNVVIAGLGGSGIGGTLAEAITYNDIKAPISLAKSYEIPSFVGKHTLFVACSFSGNTEETLEVLGKALEAGAKVVAITTGGKLAALAEEKGLDRVVFEGLAPNPRQHLPYSLTLLLLTLKAYGLTALDFESQAANAAKLIDDNFDSIKAEAKELAGKLKGKLPILYSGTQLGGLTVRFQQQLNENSKQLAHANVFPEMNHNELVGWKKLENILGQSVVMVFRSPSEHSRVGMRLDICTEIFEKKAEEVITLQPKGNSLLEQILYYTSLTDWVSFFLAELNEVDPFPVDVITYLKDELAKVK